MFGLSKIYIVIIAVIALVGTYAGTWLHGRSTGYDIALSDQAKAQKLQLKEDAEAVDEIRKKETERAKVVVRYRTITKRLPADHCIDTYTLPNDRTNELRNSYKSITGPKTD